MTDLTARDVANSHYLAALAALEDAYARGATQLEVQALEGELAAAEAEGRAAA